MLKKILKTKKIRLILILICVGFLAILYLYGMAKLFIRLVDTGTYTEYNPDKMVTYLERRYDINFPEAPTKIKAARSGKWGGYSSFLLKFTAKPSDVEKFLSTAVGSSLHNYDPQRNPKYHSFQTVPEWWKEPIEKGKRGKIYVKNTFIEDVKTPVESDIESSIRIYIDTSNEKKYVVYLRGAYSESIDDPP
jgi:hypothetical protein